MQIKRIDVDTLAGTSEPLWGRITAIIAGREVVFRLEPSDISRLTQVGEQIAADCIEELRTAA